VAGLAIAIRIHGLMSLVFVIAGLAAPWLWLRSQKRRRLAAFDEKFPDTLDMMANAMRAGYSFQAAARFVGDELPAPIGPEFARFHEEQRLGIDVRTALLGMQERIDSLNLKMFVTAVLIQRETGGNLTELLGNLASLMRDRVAVQGQIDTLTAEPKLSAKFLTALPVVLFFALGLTNPQFMDPFSSSTAGKLLLLGAGVSVIMGYIVLMKIADIDI
jgi:tight adherence protein B